MLTVKDYTNYDDGDRIAVYYLHKQDLKSIQQINYLYIIFTSFTLTVNINKKITYEEIDDIRRFIADEINDDAVWTTYELKRAIANYIDGK